MAYSLTLYNSQVDSFSSLKLSINGISTRCSIIGVDRDHFSTAELITISRHFPEDLLNNYITTILTRNPDASILLAAKLDDCYFNDDTTVFTHISKYESSVQDILIHAVKLLYGCHNVTLR